MSAIPAVKAYITELVADGVDSEPALANLQVTYGHPGSNVQDECFFIDVPNDDETDWAAIGTLRQKEKFDLDFYINIRRKGLNQKEATERGFDVYDAIYRLLSEDKQGTLGGLLIQPCLMRRRRTVEDFDKEGRTFMIIGTFRCEARG